MSAPVEGKERPRRRRFVISLDKARHSGIRPEGARPRGGIGKVIAILAAAFLVLAVLAIVGLFAFWQLYYKTTPSYSLALLVDAVQSNDSEAFDKLVDTDKVVENFVPQVTEKALGRYVSGLTAPIRRQVESLVPKLLPGVRDTVHDEVFKSVNDLSSKFGRKPFILIAVAVPWVVDIESQGETAKATVSLDNDRRVVLDLERREQYWQVVKVTDDVMAARVVDEIAKSLPAAEKQIEKEARRQLDKILPEGLPRIPFLGNGNSNNQSDQNDNQDNQDEDRDDP